MSHTCGEHTPGATENQLITVEDESALHYGVGGITNALMEVMGGMREVRMQIEYEDWLTCSLRDLRKEAHSGSV